MTTNKLKLAFAFLLATFTFSSQAQLTVQGGFTPQQLVNYFVLGSGIQITNITYTGAPNAIGIFNGVNSNIGIDSGIIITSGDIINAPGPNTNGGTTTNNLTPGDPDLNNLISGTGFDAAVLEFDFVPNAASITFNFVFASEEYNEFVNSSYNDVFAFFISGPGITGLQNMALIPLTTTPVSINNVNNGNTNTGPCMNCAYFVDNANGASVQYDAFTVKIAATATIPNPSQVYHLKLAISDVGDGSLDSGVLIEPSNFCSKKDTVHSSTANNTIIEGCDSTTVVFTFDTILPYPFSLYLGYGGGSARGIDYPWLPDSILIPAGTNTYSLNISTYGDNLTEGTEPLTIYYVNYETCIPQFDSINLYIVDVPAMSVSLPGDTLICPGNSITIAADTSGGFGNLSLVWSNGSTNTSITVNPASATTYYVTATDQCGQSKVDSITIDVIQAINVVFSNDTLVCPGSAVTLTAIVNGGLGSATYNWDNGAGTASTYTISPNQNTIVQVIVTDQCNNTISQNINIGVIPPLTVAFSADTIICSGDQITLSAYPSQPNVNYNWDNGAGNSQTYNVSPTTLTSYSVIVDDACGYQYSDTISVDVYQMPVVSLTANDSVCSSNEVTVEFTGTAAPNATFNWNFNNANVVSGSGSGPYVIYWPDAGYHTVSLSVTQNTCGAREDSVQVYNKICDIFIPNVVTPNGDGLNDYFVIKGLEQFPGTHVRIYNRWGNLVYEASDYKNDYSPTELPDGSYYYIVIRSDSKDYSGTITVISVKK